MAQETTDMEVAMTTRDVARLWGVSESTVTRLEARGQLPSFRIGRLVRFHPNDVRAVQRSRSDRTDSEPVASVAEYIEKLLSEAPPLSQEQRAYLAELLRPARQSVDRTAALDAAEAQQKRTG